MSTASDSECGDGDWSYDSFVLPSLGEVSGSEQERALYALDLVSIAVDICGGLVLSLEEWEAGFEEDFDRAKEQAIVFVHTQLRAMLQRNTADLDIEAVYNLTMVLYDLMTLDRVFEAPGAVEDDLYV